MSSILSIASLCIFFCATPAFAKHHDKPPKDLNKTFLIFKLTDYPGMFASCVSVLGFLDLCERGKIGGGRVYFGTNGAYYDPTQGANWWEYYFEPTSVKCDHPKIIAECDQSTLYLCGRNSKKLSMERMQELHHRYIKIKPHILDKVENFAAANFQDFTIIGVHYRGTDKSKETPRVPYTSLFLEIEKTIEALPDENYKIFVCSDEEAFVNEISRIFPGKILCTSATRSSDLTPIHFANSGQYQLGEEALVDCQLLSRSHLLIRTPSYFSQYAGIFNPDLPIVLVER